MKNLRSKALGTAQELSRTELKNVIGGVVTQKQLCVASADCGNGTGVTCIGFGVCDAAPGVGCYTVSPNGTMDITTC